MKPATQSHSKHARISSNIILGLGLLADPVLALDKVVDDDGNKAQRVVISRSLRAAGSGCSTSSHPAIFHPPSVDGYRSNRTDRSAS
ncbi:hypothetical protein [Solimicrobium silvestre]|uniref:Uncharacterized protein n=1 Tax=Solimicrobium silvestre TaxID=2099400 RepID=A0A2S9H225_9BURK|nr:hypothetical protein [Solimicrobium silvestre]PRC94041.1 hypothetical protein S2091_1214 [Solimicrobium silvestre]